MKLYDQTTFSNREAGEHGDCCRACVATILQVCPETLPHPIAQGGIWNTKFHAALRELRYAIRSVSYDPSLPPECAIMDVNWGDFEVPRVVMTAGKSPRGDWLHAVVWDRFAHRMVHDPHPSRDGLISVESFDYLAPYPKP